MKSPRRQSPHTHIGGIAGPGLVVLALLIGSSVGPAAQQPPDSARAPRSDTTSIRITAPSPASRTQSDSNQLAPLFSLRDAAVATGFVAATIVFFQVDRYVAERSQDEVTQANRFLKGVSKPAEAMAWPGGLVIEGGLYAIGRLRHRKRAAEVGWHGMEALAVAITTTNVLKKVVGRARPYVSADTNPHDFSFLGGFKEGHNRSSFPSGHTTSAFALAAAVASESRTKWPHEWWSAWLLPTALYGGATVVGISRLYHNEHWASDVALGAAIGTFSGIKVIQYAHEHPNNMLDRIMLRTSVVPNGSHGMALAWSLPAP